MRKKKKNLGTNFCCGENEKKRGVIPVDIKSGGLVFPSGQPWNEHDPDISGIYDREFRILLSYQFCQNKSAFAERTCNNAAQLTHPTSPIFIFQPF